MYNEINKYFDKNKKMLRQYSRIKTAMYQVLKKYGSKVLRS